MDVFGTKAIKEMLEEGGIDVLPTDDGFKIRPKLTERAAEKAVKRAEKKMFAAQRKFSEIEDKSKKERQRRLQIVVVRSIDFARAVDALIALREGDYESTDVVESLSDALGGAENIPTVKAEEAPRRTSGTRASRARKKKDEDQDSE